MTADQLTSILKGIKEEKTVEFIVKIPEREFGFFVEPYKIKMNKKQVTICLEETILKR